jgi:hypothetical protein
VVDCGVASVDESQDCRRATFRIDERPARLSMRPAVEGADPRNVRTNENGEP